MILTLTSAAFSHQGEIPPRYTCDGQDISPSLSWTGAPSGTKSMALIVYDPDAPDPAAPQMIWVHWVLYNLPADSTGLQQGITSADLPSSAKKGINDWRRTGYSGPCPPIGRHRYFFTLYALDTMLPDLDRPSKSELEKAMQGHILAEAQLMATYQR